MATLKTYFKNHFARKNLPNNSSTFQKAITPLLKHDWHLHTDELLNTIKQFKTKLPAETYHEYISVIKDYLNSRDFEDPYNHRYQTQSWLWGATKYQTPSTLLKNINQQLDELIPTPSQTTWATSAMNLVSTIVSSVIGQTKKIKSKPTKVLLGLLYLQSKLITATAQRQFSASIDVSTLDGTDGFMMTGFPATAYAGRSVSGIGDLNNDGIDDFAIGAPEANSHAGLIDVIFGKNGIGDSGILPAARNGANGFTITGFPPYAYGGCSVSDAGDINHDGIADFVVGAYGLNKAFVFFGRTGIGISGNEDISNLDGTNGFVVTGFPPGASAGSSISSGNVNQDGTTDLIIGASGGPGNNVVYVVYGGIGIGASGSFYANSLNGSNGFVISVSEGSDFVSRAGDVNKDGATDIIIGTSLANNFAGASHVIFGGNGVGLSGAIDVSNLNGINGFMITGFPPGAGGGVFVGSAGDINKDGADDLVIGTNTGTGYVIFGGTGIGASGAVNVARLNGINGFTIIVANTFTSRIRFAKNAGDINNDGTVDLIVGEPFNPSYPYTGPYNTGMVYTVFGRTGLGATGTMYVSSLTGVNGFAVTGYIGSAGGYAYGGWSISNAGDINADGIPDLIIGAPGMNAYAGAFFALFGRNTSSLVASSTALAASSSGLSSSSSTLMVTSSSLNPSSTASSTSVNSKSSSSSSALAESSSGISSSSSTALIASATALSSSTHTSSTSLNTFSSSSTARPANSTDANLIFITDNKPITQYVMLAVALGSTTFFLALLNICFKRDAKQKFEKSTKHQEAYISVITTELFEKIKMTGCLGYTTEKNIQLYVGVIDDLVVALGQQLNVAELLSGDRKNGFLNEIVIQIKLVNSGNRSCSFFKAEITPQQIRDNMETIANAVIKKFAAASVSSATLLSRIERGTELASARAQQTAVVLDDLENKVDSALVLR